MRYDSPGCVGRGDSPHFRKRPRKWGPPPGRGCSAGLGGLQRANPAGSGDLLRSNVTGGGTDFSLRKYVNASAGSTSPGTSGFSSAAAATGGGAYAPTMKLDATDGGTFGSFNYGGIKSDLSLDPYLAAMGHAAALTSEQALTTFVPTEPSKYQEYIQQGEMALRTMRYQDARDSFDIAVKIARRSPEAHLSMVNVSSALESYHLGASYLRKALELFPELPGAKIDLKKFYASPSEYASLQDKLNEQAVRRPEGDLWLLVAYFRYFGGEPEPATEALKKSVALAEEAGDSATADAANTFWDGMCAAGAATGPLTTSQPTTRKTPATSPATQSDEKAAPTGGKGAADTDNGKPATAPAKPAPAKVTLR